MRYFDRLLNFFTSNYLNNTRFHHSTLGYLKIFFERNNKLKSTFSSLGNVFRNSKWSDLKVQNIKTSFIKSWSNYFVTLFTLSFILLPFFGTYYGNTLTYYVPFLGEIYELLSFVWTHIEDMLKALLMFVFSTWSYLKSLITSTLSKRQEHLYNTLTFKIKPLTTPVTQSNLNVADNVTRNHAPIEMMYCLANSTNKLGNLKHAPVMPEIFNQIHFDSWNINDCLDSDFINTADVVEFLQLSNLEHSYTILPKQVFEIHQLDIESSNLNKISAYNVALSLTNLNTQEALKTSKEDRWLLRNSLMSENLILNSNAFTQSKKLLGTNFLNSDMSSKNVWTSAKLNSNGTDNTNNFLANIQELLMKQSTSATTLSNLPSMGNDMSNFDLFENSRFWLTKKYFFTNQLKNNTYSLTSVNGTSSTILNNNNATEVYNILVSTQAQSLNNQLSNLTLSVPADKDSLLKAYTNSTFDIHVGSNDLDLLKTTNLSFINKLTYSTSNNNLTYFTTLPYNILTPTNSNVKFENK